MRKTKKMLEEEAGKAWHSATVARLELRRWKYGALFALGVGFVTGWLVGAW